MKKIYEKPAMQVEAFVPNQCVANCGDTEKKYLFTCTSAGGTLYYYPGFPGNSATQPEPSDTHERLGGYTPCGETHETDTTADFYYGFVDHNGNGRQDGDETTCIAYLETRHERYRVWDLWPWRWHWAERDVINNWHATDNLHMDQWQTVKS